MSPEQKIKSAILIAAAKNGDVYPNRVIDSSNIDELYDIENEEGILDEYMNEMREGEIETRVPCEYSRHYESKSVAAQAADGSWVGWAYWYGGGKHGCPEEIDWISSAYDLDCVEEEKMVTVRTFTKKDIT